MSTTEAQRRASARYTAKLDQLMVRPYQAEGAQIRQAAAAAGQSTQAYILDAVRQRMGSPDAEPDGARIRLSLRADVVQGLERDGETPAQAAARILADAIRQARQDT